MYDKLDFINVTAVIGVGQPLAGCRDYRGDVTKVREAWVLLREL